MHTKNIQKGNFNVTKVRIEIYIVQAALLGFLCLEQQVDVPFQGGESLQCDQGSWLSGKWKDNPSPCCVNEDGELSRGGWCKAPSFVFQQDSPLSVWPQTGHWWRDRVLGSL